MGGQKINDHSSWVGKGTKGSVFPEGVKTRQFNSSEGAGELNTYEDTSEAIRKSQEHNKQKIRSNAPKPMYRN